MMHIYAETDSNQEYTRPCNVRCPGCGQILADITEANGYVRMRLKCRRCKRYVKVDAVGK